MHLVTLLRPFTVVRKKAAIDSYVRTLDKRHGKPSAFPYQHSMTIGLTSLRAVFKHEHRWLLILN